MNKRQEQIERIEEYLPRILPPIVRRAVATTMVDDGKFGDKNRFEISLKGVYKRSHAHIEPIDYKEEE